jgi:hypothetical protein
MGQKQSSLPRLPPPPPPPKCSGETAEASKWRTNLNDTQRIYEEKRLAAERCSPELAKARAVAARGPSECQVNDVQLNMARNDLATKDQKWAQCYPEEATQRKLRTLRDEANAYATAKRAEQREANANFQTKNNAISKLAESARELYMRLYEKEKELITLTNKRENLEQYERRERRAFLDNSPQEGTGGIPGVRTSDDRVLLTFWITYGAALILGTLFILNIYGAQLGATDIKSKVQIVAAVLLVAYGIAYGFIIHYG